VRWRRVLRYTVIAMAIVFVLMQLVPYGWWHDNPPITQAAQWGDPEAEALARSACYDCHSNESDWPVWSYVAPISWLVRSDVEGGRGKLNLSELDGDGGKELDDAGETIEEGEMPPSQYVLAHPDAKLSDAEKERLIAAFDVLEESYDDAGQGGNEDRSGSNSGPG